MCDILVIRTNRAAWTAFALGLLALACAPWSFIDGDHDRRFPPPAILSMDGQVAGLRSARELQRFDNWGDPLPPRALARLGTIRLRHGGWVKCAAFSADDKELLSFGADMTIRAWEVGTGKDLRQVLLEGSSPEWKFVSAFSPDCQFLARLPVEGFDQEDWWLLLYSTRTGKLVRKLAMPQAGCCVAFSPNQRLIAVGDSGGQIHVWDLTTGELKHRVEVQAMVTALAFSPDSSLLATGDEMDGLDLLEVASGQRIRRLRERLTELRERRPVVIGGKIFFKASLAFSPDGTLLASGNSDRVVRLWSVKEGKEIRRLEGPPYENRLPDRFNTLLFSPDGRSLVIEYNGTVELWDIGAGKSLRKWLARRQWNTRGPAICRSHSGNILATWGWENSVRLWDFSSGKELLPAEGHRDKINSIALAPDGQTIFSASDEHEILRWDISKARPYWCDWDSVHTPRQLAISPDGKTLAASGEYYQVNLFDTATGKRSGELRREEQVESWAVSFSPDGRVLATDWGRAIWLWSAHAHEKLRVLKAAGTRSLAFARDGRRLAAGTCDWSRVDLADRENLNDRLFGRIKVWDPATGKEIPLFLDEVEPVDAVAFSPDGWTLASATEKGTLSLWEMTTGQERRRLKGSGAVCFSPDGCLMAAGSTTGDIRLWDARSGKELPALAGHRGKVTALAFHPNKPWLVSASADTTILVWDLTGMVPAQPKHELADNELDVLWNDLASADATRAYEAIIKLAASPGQAVTLLGQHVQPFALDTTQFERWLTDLSSNRFAVREKATSELECLGAPAKPGLQRILGQRPTLEVRLRVERILQTIGRPAPSLPVVRTLRAVEVLERVKTPEARRLLKKLAGGHPQARLTQEAKAALGK